MPKMSEAPGRPAVIEQRLLGRCEQDGVSGCWRFLGAPTSNGYGRLTYEHRSEYAHRVSAMIFLGFDLASDLLVLHRCDVPACVNPDHLWIGTQADNMRDAAEKGRMSGGKKLDPAKVGAIKYDLGLRRPHRSLAAEYGVSTTTIGQIARGETWKTVRPRPASPSDESAETFKAGEEG
jgi:hypothetical protein